MEEKDLKLEINEPINLYINLDKYEDIYIIRNGYKIKLNKSRLLMFLELFRELEENE